MSTFASDGVPTMHIAAAGIRRASRTSLIGLIVLASAQEKPSRDREALRRTQLALRAAQEHQAALQTERDRLAQSLAQAERQRADDNAALARAQRQLQAARSGESRSSRSLADVQAELSAARGAASDDEAKLQATFQTLRVNALESQQQLAERTSANAAVTRLLEQSVAALSKTEADNQQLYAIGRELLQAYRDKSVLDAAVQRDPVLGLGEVRLENRAQAFHDRMVRLRIAPPRPASAE